MQGQMRQETESKCNEQKKKVEAYTAKVEDVVKDLVARIEVLERQNRELDGKNRDLEHRVERVAQEKRQEEEAQVERMSERAREVMGYGTQRKRLGEDDMGYEGHSGKFPRGNSAESVHDMGSRGNDWSNDNRGSGQKDYRRNGSHTHGNYEHNQVYGAPPPRLAQPPAFAPTAPARDKQELKLAIGVFRGQYATAGVGDQIALIAKSVPRSVIPGDVRRDEYRFGVLVMTFRSYNDRDAFTREWSAGYKNSPTLGYWGGFLEGAGDLSQVNEVESEQTEAGVDSSKICTMVNFASWNVHGDLIVKMLSPDFKMLIGEFDVIGLQETHLCPEEEEAMAKLQGYQFFAQSRKAAEPWEHQHGGVCAFVRNHIQVKK
ncbi:hypothetical protein F5876DRAFT_71237 [Lentinula aff. lateritia]|uniref:Uncharacterized protein n=1 Tax=Lentinula aff. lateritia TaxID=2804960 RepID=A0ACC1TGH7_9AGAR|nr:hypothetical protein F5876DRAFT_71237 [Lentinula aff. lateritia]